MRRRVPDGAEIGSVAQRVIADVGDEERIAGYCAERTASRSRAGRNDSVRHVVGVVLDAVERYRAPVALAIGQL